MPDQPTVPPPRSPHLCWCGAKAELFYYQAATPPYRILGRCLGHSLSGAALQTGQGPSPIFGLPRTLYDMVSPMTAHDQDAVDMLLRMYSLREAIEMVAELRAQDDQESLEAYLAAAALAPPRPRRA